MRVQRPVPVAAKSVAWAMATKPLRAASFWSIGTASSRLPSTTSTVAASSGTRARTLSLWGGTKWIIRSSLTGSSRKGAGAPVASGWKKRRGSFMRVSGSQEFLCVRCVFVCEIGVPNQRLGQG